MSAERGTGGVSVAVRRYLKPFLAMLALATIGLATATYILAHQRLRFPIVEDAPIEIRAEFSTAQAVVPGQGQTVRVSGVRVGDVGEVRLRDGHAEVTLEIDRRYDGLVREDATALLRPKTGLKDMFVELDPGRGRAVPAGWTIPRSQTAPDVNLDELNAMLDADTRDYLRLLVHGAGRALDGRGRDLREVYRMFEPTHRDLARVSRATASRRESLRRLVHSLRLLSTELGDREGQLAELVESAARVMRAYASEDRNITRAVHLLPDALEQTTSTLRRVERYADALGPTVERLRPAVRAIPAANESLAELATEATPLLRDDVVPFVGEARPLARDLAAVAPPLVEATPEITRYLAVLNKFLNQAAHNPNGREGPENRDRQEGYLFYLAWLVHQSSNVHSTADAHGNLRPSLVAASCHTFQALAHSEPQTVFLLNLAPLLAEGGVCDREDLAE